MAIKVLCAVDTLSRFAKGALFVGALTVIFLLAVFVQPLAPVAVTVYVVVTKGVGFMGLVVSVVLQR